MSRRAVWGAAVLLACCAAAARADGPEAAPAGDCASGACASGGCAAGYCPSCACGHFGCLHCPKTCFPREKPPCIKWKCVCPKPVCDVCGIEGYGYFATCWRPWAYPPNYEACPVPPPGVLASQAPPLLAESGPADETLPVPNRPANPMPNR